MNKLCNSTHEPFAAFACSIFLTAIEDFGAIGLEEMKRLGLFKNAYGNVRKAYEPLTDELLKVNSALKPIFSVIEDQCSGGQ